MRNLHLVMPTQAELPVELGWHLDHDQWWSVSARLRDAHVYLNGWGTDDELRFHLRARVAVLPCRACSGTGRVFRAQDQPSPFFLALAEGRDRGEYDAADETGRRKCHVCFGDGKVKPFYGAANDFFYDDDEGTLLRRFGDRIGSRGLSSPEKTDVLFVLDWVTKIALSGK